MASGKDYWLSKRYALELEPKVFKLILEADIGAPPSDAGDPVPETNVEFNSQVAQPPSPTDDTVNN